MIFLMSTTEQDVIDALAQINSNCSFPSLDAETWDNVKQAYQQNIWFIYNPQPGGYNGQHAQFTGEEMMEGVVNVTESNGSPDWWPPDE